MIWQVFAVRTTNTLNCLIAELDEKQNKLKRELELLEL